MRPTAVSPFLLALAGCLAEDPAPTFIEDLVERSAVLACAAAEIEDPPPMVNRLKVLNDTLLGVIAAGSREIRLLGRDLRTIASVGYAEEGPGALLDPRDLDMSGDTLLAVADRALARIQLLDLAGRDRGRLDLGFPPQRLLRLRDGYLVSATLLTPAQGELLFRASSAKVEGLGVSALHVADWQLRTLANLTVLEPLGGGRVVLGHQFIEPAAHVLDFTDREDRPAKATRASVPLPEAAREAVGRLPQRPFTEEALMALVAPILEAASDSSSGRLLYLTRSGRRLRGYHEKVLIRVDRDLRYLDSFLLPVNVGPFAYLRSREEIVAVAEDERWYRCPLPPRIGA